MDELLELPAGSLTGSEKIRSLERWDSLALVGFIALSDEKLGETAPPARIAQCETVADLIGLFGNRIN
jgi:acyl carrier protein